MKFYSWKDIERCCLLNKQRWENDIDSIEVYPSEITVYKKEDMSHSISHVLKQVLNEHFDEQNSQVKLDIGNIRIPVYEQEFQGSWEKPILPLFRDILYRPASYPSQEPHPLPKPLIAFHSYKGGVGRTLSLIAFAKAWSAAFENTDHAKLLIIDSDLEAPGLTWLQDKQFEEDTISYLDLLTLIQDNSDVNQLVDLVCAKLTTSTLSIETQTRTVEHFFIPTYRYEEQLLDLYATPESIVNGRNKEYILADVISGICARLGAAVCLVDLRAGISEFSSTLLLDSRVKKYLVTSTSTQSIRGTQMILKYLMRGLSIREDSILPEVFLTMVPDGLPSEEKNNMINELHQFYEQDQSGDEDSYFTDNVITELPFASELIHLTSMKQILNNLSGRDMYFRIQKLVDQNYFAEVHPLEEPMDEENRKDKLAKIHQLAEMQLTAEGNSKFEVLMTESLKFLGKKYSQTVPTTVIMGAKGAGKTFLYRKMAESKDWASFCKELYGSALSAPDGYFLPIIATRNSNELIKTLGNCIQNLNQNVSSANVNESVFLDNAQSLEQQKTQVNDWMEFWQKLLVSSIHPDWRSFQQANEELEKVQKKIVFLVDGLEDIFKQASKSEVEKKAIQVLCQDVMNQLIARYHNLGIIIFVRRDMVQASIPINFKQFEQNYKQAELKWSSNEALKLAVWLVSQAIDDFYNGPKEINTASRDVIEENLIRLWGLKLGKASSNEAYASRWILAALSDFNGQLQARDIIRFLKYATSPTGKKAPYQDRLLMPAEIKNAVFTCSNEKMEEVKQEYTALRPIFEKLEQLPSEKKSLPLDSELAQLNNDEEKNLILEGYLKRDGDKYYLPEIIRHALGFRYSKGARPKVLSLTLKH